MNKEQIEKLKEVALRAPKNPGEWPFYLRSFQAAASPEVILELIALAEHSLSAQDEVLTDDDLTQEFSLDMIIKGIRYADHGRHEGWEKELAEYIRVECNRAVAAAAPSPVVAMEPAQLTVATHSGAYATTVVINLVKGDTTTCLYSMDHVPNGESIGVADLPDHLFATPSPSLAILDVVELTDNQIIKRAGEIFGIKPHTMDDTMKARCLDFARWCADPK